MMRSTLFVVGLLSLCVWTTAAEVVQWRRDFSGVFPGQNPPISWSDGTAAEKVTRTIRGRKKQLWELKQNGKQHNIRWSSPLPNWSNSSIIVTGDRVILTCEPTGYAPWLLCFDAHSGTELWRREVCSLTEREPAVAARWAQVWEHERRANEFRARARGADAATFAKLQQEAASAGYRLAYKMKKGKRDGLLCAPEDGSDDKNALKKQHGLRFGTWDLGSDDGMKTWVGHAYPCPVSDGERIWMFTAYDDLACFDMDGKQLWIRHYGVSAAGCTFTAHPLLVDGVLILADGDGHFVRGVDPATGELLWQHAIEKYSVHSNHSPAPLLVDGQAYVFHPRGTVYRPRDGKIMADDLGGMGKGAGIPVSAGDTVYYRRGNSGAQAYRFTAQGDALQAEKLWEHKKRDIGTRTAGLVYQGAIYSAQGERYDAATGDQQSSHRLWGKTIGIDAALAGKHLYFGGKGGHYINDQGGIYVLDITTDEIVATNWLSCDPVDAAKLKHIRRETARDSWYPFWNGSLFIAHDRLYLRSYDRLFCIGAE